jgi:rRNA small subunit pseudouridine methyltransferase Nep1
MPSAAVLNLIIAEAALELVPPGIAKHPAVRNEAKRRELKPTGTLLDRSIHHHAMLSLAEDSKRGRPDLVHLTLLSITSTPLYQSGRVKVYIHTHDDRILELKELTRPPKSYARFRDLVQKLLDEEPEEGLITAYRGSIPELLRRIGADFVVGLSTQGKTSGLKELAVEISTKRNPAVLIGGFPKGHFTPETAAKLDTIVRIHPDSLDAHVVAARLVYELERVGQVPG